MKIKDINRKYIDSLIKDNNSLIKEYLINYHFEDYTIIETINDYTFIIDYKNKNYRKENSQKTIDVLDYETILNLGYSNLIQLFKEFNIKPKKKCSNQDIPHKIVKFMKQVMKPLINLNDYEIKLTDGSLDEPYYITSFVRKDIYLKDKDYYDKDLISFKCASDYNNGYYVVFEMNQYPKSYLNLTGEAFHKKNQNSYELFRGILLSYIYFGNNEFKD